MPGHRKSACIGAIEPRGFFPLYLLEPVCMYKHLLHGEVLSGRVLNGAGKTAVQHRSYSAPEDVG